MNARIGLQDGSCIISSGTEMEEIGIYLVMAVLGKVHPNIVPIINIQRVRAPVLVVRITALKHMVL